MIYDVAVDASPAYELLVSLWAYIARAARKTLDLGPEWVAQVGPQLDDSLRMRLRGAEKLLRTDLPALLIWQCPYKDDVAGFLDWLGTLSSGALYELFSPFLLDDQFTRLRDLGGWRDATLALLRAWEEQYFHTVDPAIQVGLAANAAVLRSQVGTISAPDLVEAATAGLCLEPAPDLASVVLVPQYHYQPWNLQQRHRGLHIILYPVDAVATPPAEPPPRLLRLTGALADENRLRMLRFLASSRRSFMEVVEATGLAKSTVHYHLVALRAAGLVRVHVTGESATDSSYSLRSTALDEVRARLDTYLHGDAGTDDRPIP